MIFGMEIFNLCSSVLLKIKFCHLEISFIMRIFLFKTKLYFFNTVYTIKNIYQKTEKYVSLENLEIKIKKIAFKEILTNLIPDFLFFLFPDKNLRPSKCSPPS